MIRLTLIRETRGWSRAELSRRVKMAPGDVGKIEARRLLPYGSQLRKLGRALGLRRAEALSLLDHSHGPTHTEILRGWLASETALIGRCGESAA